eukprot:TRINITY_DN19115_c0_g1_i2.p1 TRINITY_DN19115_c0_g1~~TRINITY_DN19115_c0_g1_i2.p1  ORF type:complete len:218 (+),score=46.96 TRINITY_DN19115_c0_g1_i2:64-717(+)
MLIDEDGDGQINASELQQALEMNGATLSLAEVRTVMQKADTNGNGMLSLSEFKAWMNGPSPAAASGPQLDDGEFKRLFSLFDENGDGEISVVELWKTMQYVGIGLSFAHAEEMMKVADTNRDGAIDFHEFKKVMADAMGPQGTMTLYPAPDPRLKRVFSIFDTDGDGKINIQELYKGLKLLGLNLTLAEVMAIMRHADKNDDGKLDFREFSRVIHLS